MRLTSAPEYLGGADNVNVFTLIRGEQVIYTGSVTDNNGDPIDTTNFTFSAVAEFYTADVTITGTGSRASAAISNLQPHTKDDATLVTAHVDDAGGEFSITIPASLADDSDTSGIDTSTGVLLPVVYITYDDGNGTIRKSRLVLIIRHSA